MPPDVDGIKICDTDDQAIKHCSYLNVGDLVIFIKKFDTINIRSPWAPEKTMFCSEFIMTKTFKPIIKTSKPWLCIVYLISLASLKKSLFLYTVHSRNLNLVHT